MLGWLWRRGHQADALGRVEAMPRPLRHDDGHPGAHSIGLRAVRRHGVERRRAVDDLHELIAVRMAFPRSVAGELGAVDVAVAKWRQRGEPPAPLAIAFGHLRSTPAQQGQFVELGLEIQDRDHSVLRGRHARTPMILSQSLECWKAYAARIRSGSS